MIVVYFIYGLAFFSLGLAAFLESRHASKLPLGQQLPWLAGFGLLHSLVEWSDMFLLIIPPGLQHTILLVLRSILLPLSTLLLVRFGTGLIKEAGPLPEWLSFAPVVLLVPAGLLLGYALIVAVTEPPLATAADVWSRYLLYFTGNLLAAFGFFRQWQGLAGERVSEARPLMLGAAAMFVINAFFAGLIVMKVPYGLGAWLNAEWLLSVTGIPVQLWRALTALAVTLFVVWTLDVFEAERKQQLADLDQVRLVAQQAALQAQSTAREAAEEWTNALVKLSQRISNMDHIDDILLAIVEDAQRLLNADTAALALWNESGAQLETKYFASDSGSALVIARPVKNQRILEAIINCCSLRYPEDSADLSKPWICPAISREILSAAIVPLRMEQKSLGGLWVERERRASFDSSDLVKLDRLADQAVIAIEHALMASRLQSLAVLEERSRIAREMHDGIAQILGYLSLETQTLEALVDRGEQQAALAELKQARLNIQLAQEDVRENILCLRTTLSGEAGVISALREYVEEFSVQTGVQANLVCQAAEPLNLSPLAETQMVRIIQEALANVRKHARACQVLISLSSHNGGLCVTIADDGLGFEIHPERGHYGLLTMRERAESVGGGLTVTSCLGEGTQIEMWLPISKR